MPLSIQRTILASALVFVLFANYAFAHTYLSSIFLNGQALNEGDCVRPHPPQDKEYPIAKVTDADMTCGWLPYSANPANRKCPVAAGSQIGMQWWHNSPGDDVLSTTHKGPVSVYLARSDNGAGNVWFKIYEDGYNAATGQWATDKLIANRGRLDFTLPADIAPGNYLMRGEIFALHNAYDVYGIQPYVGCVELTISGSGSATPQGVAFPGYYTPTGPGMLFNIYQYYNSYTIPGPAVYKPSPVQSTTSPTIAPTAAPTSAPTYAPTAAPTIKSTSAPTNAPTYPPPPSSATTRPTQPPTATPTAAPIATAAPTAAPIVTAAPTAAPIATAAPTTAPHYPYSTIKFSLNQGSNAWWVGVIVSGYSETLIKVDIMDGKALTSWAACSDMGYAYVFYQNMQLSLPLSVRLTSSKGNQIILSNAITSWSTNVIDTYTNFPSYA